MPMSEPKAHVLRAGVDDPDALAELVLSHSWRVCADVLKRDNRVEVLHAAAPGFSNAGVISKTWRLRPFRDAFGATQAQRHWRNAETLADAGVRTAKPLLLFRFHKHGDAFETLIMEALGERTLLHVLDDIRRGVCDIPFPALCALARAVGDQVRAVVATGRFNRDHKPSNIVPVRDDANGAPRWTPAIVDVVDIRHDGARTGGARMLASLMIEPIGVRCPPSRTMRMRALKGATADAPRAARKTAWRGVEQMINAHGDPTPRVNPLKHPTT